MDSETDVRIVRLWCKVLELLLTASGAMNRPRDGNVSRKFLLQDTS
jgi:hypothetical protein